MLTHNLIVLFEVNMDILTINPDDYQGGIGVWASFNPAFTNRNRRNVTEPISGVHVHARKRLGIAKCIDYTFDLVILELSSYGMGFREVANNMMLSYFIAENLGHKIKSLKCPHCGHPHLDEGELNTKPHSHHLCLNCNRDFHDIEESVSNPLMEIRQTMIHRRPEPPVAAVNREVDILKDEYPGGIEMYGTHKALIWTSTVPQESGIHLHCYAEGGKNRLVDDTYGIVDLNGVRLNPTETQLLQAQLISSYLRPFVKTVYCPKCHSPQKDIHDRACTPHVNFTCENCNHSFHEETPCVSNSMFDLLVSDL